MIARSIRAKRVLVFDLDDTLYLERDFAFSGYVHVGDWVQQQFGAPDFGLHCRQAFERGERTRIFNHACQAVGLEADPDLISRLIDVYRNHPPAIDLCADVARFFARSSGPFGLVTDGPEQMQRNKIAALGLEAIIAHICPTGAWPKGYRKPHPRAYELMEQAASGARMVYVADNPAKDFVTPRARGWVTVQINRPGRVHAPDAPDDLHAAGHVIDSLDDLDAVLAN
ncbi:HAD family hydrolase [Aliiroseovarius halocynthiae]|uniref:HAD family hydrolase n=1 Tax=Aliiroseovarius halocynthiae TaxID=985055 RepID=A0A545SUK0_9RHOB|nr:HAD family hydrolase [Aliiroseovarius halocynthiae]